MVMIHHEHRRVWAEIDLDALEHNYRAMRARLGDETAMCCVIKANAYGHGAVDIATAYQQMGADLFAVSNIEEAIQLRQGGIVRPILILGYTPPPCVHLLARHQLTQCVYSYEYACLLAACAKREGVSLRVHIKIDTGMGRIGFVVRDEQGPDEQTLEELLRVCALESLSVDGIFTHFAVADDGAAGDAFCQVQHAALLQTVKALEARGVTIPCKHCANSAAAVDHPEYRMDMVRAGIVLYGHAPSPAMRRLPDLRPVMTLKSVVSHIKTVRPGDSVSYGRTFVAERDMRIATVPIGYADGYRRASSENGAYLLLRGKRCPIVGRVCMDQLMIDVSHVPSACVGDEVTVFGAAPAMTADALADCNGTVAYEILCAVGVRVPRVYLREGRVVCVRDNLLSETEA